MASNLEQAARDLAQAAIQDTAGGVLTQQITAELKAVAAATKSLEKTVEQGNSATSAELARVGRQCTGLTLKGPDFADRDRKFEVGRVR